MATTKVKDIRETGPQSYRDLQRQNDQALQGAQSSVFANLKPVNDYKSSTDFIYEGGEMSPLQQSGNDYWGKSRYDNPTANEEEYQARNLDETRYENQAWYDTLANGVGKMLGTAGTTFVSSLVGLPYGLMQAAAQDRWSALWDNDVTQGLADVDKWLEENMTNYKSEKQKNSPWYDPSNLFSMNLIADDIIKNAGFTLGAAASMAVGSGTLGLLGKSMGFVNDVSKGAKMVNNGLSALFSATGEGMIEARQGVEERNKLEFQRLDDELAPEINALRTEYNQINQEYAANKGKALVRGADGRLQDPAYIDYINKMSDLEARRDAINQRREAGRQQIEESGQKMGNIILGANQVLLTAGNMIQFGKAMTKSFDRARHAAETSSKYAKPFGVSAARTAEGTYEITGKGFGKTVAATKVLLTEGSEEMNQQWIQNTAGNIVAHEDVNDYWKAKLDPDAIKDTVDGTYTLGQAISKGFADSWGDKDQWEQFVIGGLTGLAGSYSPTKLFNQDKSKAWYNPRRYGSWEGGAINEVRDFNKEYNQYEESINDVNKILQQEDFPARVKSMIAHTFLENQKTQAAENDDMKAWKDADDKQTIHDIQTFLRAGKLDDLRTIYQEMGKDLSDDDVEDIVKRTTKEISAEEDKQNFSQSIDEQIGQHRRRITELKNQAQAIADNQEILEVEERGQYQAAVTPQLEKIFEQIDTEYDAIDRLNQQKDGYVGQKRYEGTYVDEKGNRTATNDEIREQVKHNADELNRKLDSYLDSIDYVNRRTKGRLTKDQEDNLAYLHNMGKESQVRMQKIMANVRKQLPSKFLLKTDKTPEQLSKETASSDVVFSKNEDTKEGYVEVDTSAMEDSAFADFFQREVMRGGNIMPEFAETADERAAREADEQNLTKEEKKQKAKERASKKWKDAIQKMQDDANEQWDTNWKMLVDNFMNNYSRKGNTNIDETIETFGKLRQDLQDASDLFDQTGEFQRTLMEYMQNPSQVDEDRKKEEDKADKANTEQRQKNQFAGKTAKQMNQEVADGALNIDDIDNFADADLSSVTDDDVKAAQDEAKKSRSIRQKQASLKQHIQENLGENPTQEELDAAQTAMQMIDNAALAAENPEDLSIDVPELSQVPIDEVDPNASIEDIDDLNQQVQEVISKAFNGLEEDKSAQDDIPEDIPDTVNDVEPVQETGNDAVPITKPEVVVPKTTVPPGTEQKVITEGNLTEGAIDNIIEETRKVTPTNTNGTWRSTTTRHPYGRSAGTYHENIAKPQFGGQSVEYKRSKAIWEYLDSVGAFDRMDNASEDRIKSGKTVHFMVMYLPDVFGARIEEVSDDNKPFATVILMLNENGEVIGDLPLAQLEPSYKAGNPTQQVKDLLALQEKLFNSFYDNHAKTGGNQAIVDGALHIEGIDNLNLTFNNARKTPLVSKVKQVMRGSVPYSKTERHTLNEVAAGSDMQLGIKVANDNGSIIAVSRGDKTRHTEIVAPNVGMTGQPYLLLPTPSGEKIAVPFYTKPFDVGQHKNTEMYKLLCNAISALLYNNRQSDKNQKDAFMKHLDVIEALLQVEKPDDGKIIEEKGDTITLHLQSLTDANQKYNVTIQKTGDTAKDALAIVDKMPVIPINVSLQYLNNKIKSVDLEEDYNKVIGEIADVSLPENTTHTVNGWFTIELAPNTGIKPSKPLVPKTTGIVTEFIGGRNIEINTDNYTAVDTATGEIIEGDEQVNLRLAQIKASKPMYKGKDFIQISIEGDVRTYDVKNNKFVKQKEQKPETTITQTKENSPSIDVTPPTSGTVALGGQPQAGSVIEIDVPTMAGGTRKEKVQKVSVSELKVGDVIWRSGTETEAPISQGTVVAIEKGNLYVDNALVPSATKALYRVVSTNQPTTSGKTFDVEDIVKMWEIYASIGTENIPKVLNEVGYQMVEIREAEKIFNERHPNGVEQLDEEGLKEVAGILGIQVPENSAKTIEEIEDEMKQNKTVTRQNKDAWAAIPNDLKLKLVNEGASIQLGYNGKNVVVSLSNRNDFMKELNTANMAAKSGGLQVSEAAKPMEKGIVSLSKEKEREARRWLAKNLPSLSSEERTQFVERIARAGQNANKVWGSYRAGVIEIQKGAPVGIVYHEAFHYVVDMVLNAEEKKMLLDVAKEEYGITDDWVAEERLANDFRRYAMDENATGITGRIKRWMRRLWDRITRYNRIEDTAIKQLFWKINNGELAQRSQEAENLEETRQTVLREIRNVQREKNAWSNLNRETKQSLKDSGLSEAAYNNMSLEEKEQWLRCRT